MARVDVGWSLAGKKNSQEYVATGKKWVIYLPPTARSLLEWMANVGHLSEKMSMMILWILGLPFFQTGPYGLFHLLGLLNAAH